MPTVRLLAVCSFVFLACTVAADPQPGPTSADPPPRAEQGAQLVRVIVVAKVDKEREQAGSVAQVESLARKLGATRVDPMKGTRFVVVEMPANEIPALEASQWVERVERDRPEGLY